MRLTFRCLALACALLLAACATHPPAPIPPPPEPPPVAAPPVPEPAPPKKPKPRAKPAPAPAATKPAPDALAPEEVGYYMDVMQGRLKQTAGANLGMQRRGDRVVITVTAMLDASTGRPEIDIAHSRAFAGIAKVLAEYRKTRVAVHATNIDGAAGDAPARAACEQALLRYLEGAGVAPEQLGGALRNDPAPVRARSAYYVIDVDPLRGEPAPATR